MSFLIHKPAPEEKRPGCISGKPRLRREPTGGITGACPKSATTGDFPGSEAESPPQGGGTGIPPYSLCPRKLVHRLRRLAYAAKKNIKKFFTQNSKPVERNQAKKGIIDQIQLFNI
jgi:hypothetical protein